ncbi:MAG: RHS repeat-associated core domain-containing protein [Anaerolineae bacterium]
MTDYLNDLQPGLTKLLKQDDGTNVEQFVHAPRGIHAVDDGTDWNFYAQDGLDSVRAVVDEMAVVQSSMSYDPYGNPMAAYGAGFGFTGEQTDEDGQIYLRKRYYNPTLGNFIKRDPLATPNRYAYVSGNPVNNVDPSGLLDWCTGNVEPGDTLGTTIYSTLVYNGANSYGATVEERFHNVLTDLSQQLRNNNHPLYRENVGNYGIIYNAGQQLYPTITNIPLSNQMRSAVGISCSTIPDIDCPPDTLNVTGTGNTTTQATTCCGPDVTEWIHRELEIHMAYAQTSDLRARWNPAASLEALTRLSIYGLAVDYGAVNYRGLAEISAQVEGLDISSENMSNSCQGVISVCGRCQNSTDFGNFILGAAIHSAGWPAQIAAASGPIFNTLSGDTSSGADNAGVNIGYQFGQNGLFNATYDRQGFCDSLLSMGDSWLDTVRSDCANLQPCSSSNLNCAPNSTAHWNTFVSNSLGNSEGFATPFDWALELGFDAAAAALEFLNSLVQ